MHVRTNSLRALAAAALLALGASPLAAQAWWYPAFQLPTAATREFNFAVADADALGTSLLFQWRQAYGAQSQLSFDVGFADVDAFNDEAFFVGGQFGHEIVRSNAQTPFDVLLTGGLNFGFAENVNILRIPIGASLGRRLPLEGALSITPFVHPKLAVARMSMENPFGEDVSNTEFGFEVDLGVDFEFSPAWSLRLAGGFGSDEVRDDTFGLSLAWHPGRASARSTPARPATRR